MKRRLYYMLPDVRSARAMLDELLLARVEYRRIHFCAKEGSLLPDMPEANAFQKTDLVHGAEVGILIGAVSGFIAASLFLLFPLNSIEARVLGFLVSILMGAVLGSWISGINASAIPNASLAPFRERIERGQVLMIVDVPFHRVEEFETMIEKRHPEVDFGGVDPHIPIIS
ncbi:MAG: hypothetical protein ACEQSE_03535 [Candidatus Aquirickettsiella gammari]